MADGIETSFVALLLISTRSITGLSLVIAGMAKVRGGHQRFLNAVLGYDLLPGTLARAGASLLPPFEVLVGILLVFGLLTTLATAIAIALLMMFSAAITLSLTRGKKNVCGCGTPVTPVQWRLVRRNAILVLLLLPSAAFGGGHLSIDAIVRSVSLPVPTVIAGAVGAFGAGISALVAAHVRVRVLQFVREGRS